MFGQWRFCEGMQKAYGEVQAKTFEFRDCRDRALVAEEVSENAVSRNQESTTDSSNNQRPLALLSRLASQTPAAGIIYPR